MAHTQILVLNPKAQNKDLRWLAVDNQNFSSICGSG